MLLKRTKSNRRAQLKEVPDQIYTTNNLETRQELDKNFQFLLCHFTSKICEGNLIELPETENETARRRTTTLTAKRKSMMSFHIHEQETLFLRTC